MQAIQNAGRNGVFVMKIDEDDISTILLNTDIDSEGLLHYAYDNFADTFSDNILEYAFAYATIPRDEITKKHREAAKSLIKLHELQKLKYYFDENIPEDKWDKDFLNWYRRKDVFGEVILHMVLKEFKNTIPLISKMYFKDSFSQEAKGFDSVHVSAEGKTFWLGETKFYTSWKKHGVVSGGID